MIALTVSIRGRPRIGLAQLVRVGLATCLWVDLVSSHNKSQSAWQNELVAKLQFFSRKQCRHRVGAVETVPKNSNPIEPDRSFAVGDKAFFDFFSPLHVFIGVDGGQRRNHAAALGIRTED